jgi:hypothetical protein
MKRTKGKIIVDFDDLHTGYIFHKGKGKLLTVVEKTEDSVKVTLDGLKDQVFSLTKEQVNKGKYSFL